jgi:hypothetical protein
VRGWLASRDGSRPKEGRDGAEQTKRDRDRENQMQTGAEGPGDELREERRSREHSLCAGRKALRQRGAEKLLDRIDPKDRGEDHPYGRQRSHSRDLCSEPAVKTKKPKMSPSRPKSTNTATTSR